MRLHQDSSQTPPPELIGARRRLPIGAEVMPEGGVHFRVWAPRCGELGVVLESGPGAESGTVAIPLWPEPGGYFSAFSQSAAAGTLYRFQPVYKHGPHDRLVPDPASRFQPRGPHGPSRVEDPGRFAWTDDHWTGVELGGQVIYEMHIGAFTREGTWRAATRELDELAAAGITLIEVLPVADFAGEFGWGYDGVDLYAPTRLYGEPDDMRAFVDRAHALGIGVILDVVYNHLGPDGNYLACFSNDYFSTVHTTDWGLAINYDGPGCGPVREFYIANAGYWIDEFHLDGLRIDATQDIHDCSDDHILAALTRQARQVASRRGRSIVFVAENEPQHAKLVRSPRRGGYGLDAMWNDDYHHSAMVALTGRNEAYYTDYQGTPQELISAVKRGFLYQGQLYGWQHKRRGAPALDIEPARFVHFLQNHDQIANSAGGQRCHMLASPGRYRAMMALTLLGPATPMLFMGQEFAASAPFLYFADHTAELNQSIRAGRAEFLAQFPSLATAEVQARLADPCDRATFEACKLDLGERLRHAGAYALTRDLLALRRRDPAFRAQRSGGVDGAVLGAEALVLRVMEPGLESLEPMQPMQSMQSIEPGVATGHGDRLLIVNLGRDLDLCPAPEPLLAPPGAMVWSVLWSSEHPRYGGSGNAAVESQGRWRLPGHAAVVLAPVPAQESEEEDCD
jgi:maltooligosyltrehalose trehalohydrolase